MKIAIVICVTIIICLLIFVADEIMLQRYEIKKMEQKIIEETLKLEKERLRHKK